MRKGFSWAALASAMVLGAAPAFAAGATARNDKWSLTEDAATKCPSCPAGISFSFVSTNTVTGATARFTINSMMDRVISVHLFESKGFVIGALGTNGFIFTVYDLDKGQPLDEFYGLNYSTSPSGRFVAFLRFHPRHTSDQDTSDVLLLYDLSHSKSENRTSENRKKPSEWNAGIPMFPKQNRAGGRVSPYPDVTYTIYPQIVWSPSGKAFAFVAEAAHVRDLMEKGHTTKEITAVTISVPGSSADAKVYLRRIQTDALLGPKMKSSLGYKFNVRSMSLHDDGRMEFKGDELKPDASANPLTEHDEQY